jgi:hypothetical protein
MIKDFDEIDWGASVAILLWMSRQTILVMDAEAENRV